MSFPLSSEAIGLWLAVTAIILLATSELLSSTTGHLGGIVIERKRLRMVAAGVGIAFLFIVFLRLFQS